jgi:hypothetical protein
MKRAVWAIFVCGILFAGCASVFDFRREEVFEDSAKRYGRLIRWSDFENAKAYLAPAPSGTDTPLPTSVRVTDYEVKQMAYAEGKRQVVQVVDISYYLTKDPRIKTLKDQQLWEFDSDRSVWLNLGPRSRLRVALPNVNWSGSAKALVRARRRSARTGRRQGLPARRSWVGSTGDRLRPVDLLLQLQDAVEQRLGRGRAAQIGRAHV